MAQYQEELRSAGKWGEGTFDDELELDEDLTAATPMARHFSVGGDAAPAASVVRQASASLTASLGRDASVPDLAGTGLGSIPMPPSMASVAANVMNLSNQAALEQAALVSNPLAHVRIVQPFLACPTSLCTPLFCPQTHRLRRWLTCKWLPLQQHSQRRRQMPCTTR